MLKYVKERTFWKSIKYIIHCDKAQMLKKLLSDKMNGTKKYPLLPFASSNSSQFCF